MYFITCFIIHSQIDHLGICRFNRYDVRHSGVCTSEVWAVVALLCGSLLCAGTYSNTHRKTIHGTSWLKQPLPRERHIFNNGHRGQFFCTANSPCQGRNYQMGRMLFDLGRKCCCVSDFNRILHVIRSR